MKRRVSDYVEDILESIQKIEDFTEGMDYNAFVTDAKTLYAVRTALQIIGEASAKIPEDIRKKHSDIPWVQIRGLRNRIVHEYFGLDVRLIWNTIKNDLPVLKPEIGKLLDFPDL